MKPGFAQLSPAVAATFTAAIGISLSVFLLPGAAVEGGPMPLLPAISGVAGRVIADLPAPPAPPIDRTSEQIGKAASTVQPVATLTQHFPPQRPPAAPRAHRRARIRVAPHAPSTSEQGVAPAAPETPPMTARLFSTKTKSKGKARGHNRALRPKAEAAAPQAHGQGKPLRQGTPPGHSSEHHHGLPPGQAKKLGTVPSPALAAPQKAGGGGPPHDNGGGNGHKGDTVPSPALAAPPKAGGGPPTDNGGGNGHKGDKK